MSNVLQTGLTVVSVALFLTVAVANHSWGSNADTLYLDLRGTFDIGMFGVGLDVAVTPDGKVFISDPGRSSLWNLQKDTGTFVPVDFKGVTKGYYLNPVAIAADRDMRLWIANPDLHQILVCKPDGEITVVFDKKTVYMDWPVSLSGLSDGRIAAWDSKEQALILFSTSENRGVEVRRLRHVLHGNAVACVVDASDDIVCLDSDQRSLVKIKGEKVVARQSFSEKDIKDYVRLSDLEIGPGGYLYVTDSAGRRLMYLGSDFQTAGRFLLYEQLFRTPTSFAFQTNDLWLIDEGRKELMHFVVRSASSGLEHALLGEEYLVLGYFGPGLKEFKTAKGSGRAGPDVELLLGKAFYGLKQYAQALSAFSKAYDEGISSASFWKGNALFRLGRYQAAETAYQSALASQNNKNLVWFNLGQTYLVLNHFQEAREAFSQILFTEPDSLQAMIGLGKAYAGQRAYVKAIEVFKKLALQRPVAREARYYLGTCYLGLGAYEEAIPLLEQAASQGPYFKDAFKGLARAYRATGKWDASDRYARKADMIKNNPSFDDFLLEEQLL
jgi:tetratricopeptide (TPR) repeat protein